jgi:hypothetical protein
MMTQQLPAYVVFLLFATAILVWILFVMARKMWRWLDLLSKNASAVQLQFAHFVSAVSSVEVEIKALNAAIGATIERLGPAAEVLKLNMAGVPLLLEQVAKIGSAQLEVMKGQSAHPFGKASGAPNSVRDQGLAEKEYRIAQMMQSGMSREQAEIQINPVNGESVWDAGGKSVFDRW